MELTGYTPLRDTVDASCQTYNDQNDARKRIMTKLKVQRIIASQEASAQKLLHSHRFDLSDGFDEEDLLAIADLIFVMKKTAWRYKYRLLGFIIMMGTIIGCIDYFYRYALFVAKFSQRGTYAVYSIGEFSAAIEQVVENASKSIFDARRSPNGTINMVTAENQLVDQEFLSRFQMAPPDTSLSMRYADHRGDPALRQAIRNHLERRLVRNPIQVSAVTCHLDAFLPCLSGHELKT